MDLFHEAGFTNRGGSEWVLRPDAPRPKVPDWFAVIDRAGAANQLPASGESQAAHG